MKTIIIEVDTTKQNASKLITRINALTKRLIEVERQQQEYWNKLLRSL